MQNSLPTMPRSGEFAQVADWPDETTLLVRIQGALDFYSVPGARRLLLDQLERRPGRVVIDVSRALVDSSGIGLLVQVAQLLRLERGDLRVVCDEQLGRILRLHKLHELIPIEETPEAALGRSLSRSRSAHRARHQGLPDSRPTSGPGQQALLRNRSGDTTYDLDGERPSRFPARGSRPSRPGAARDTLSLRRRLNG